MFMQNTRSREGAGQEGKRVRGEEGKGKRREGKLGGGGGRERDRGKREGGGKEEEGRLWGGAIHREEAVGAPLYSPTRWRHHNRPRSRHG